MSRFCISNSGKFNKSVPKPYFKYIIKLIYQSLIRRGNPISGRPQDLGGRSRFDELSLHPGGRRDVGGMEEDHDFRRGGFEPEPPRSRMMQGFEPSGSSSRFNPEPSRMSAFDPEPSRMSSRFDPEPPRMSSEFDPEPSSGRSNYGGASEYGGGQQRNSGTADYYRDDLR